MPVEVMSAENLGTFQIQGPLLKVAIEDLRPTQMTVGMLEVAEKSAELDKEPKEKRHEYLDAHPVPVVRGPGGGLYLIDHHHLVRALFDSGFHHAVCAIVADLSAATLSEFWTKMERQHWVYPYDAQGKLRGYTALPKTVAGLTDDPYRSLAGAIRKAGGYRKTTPPFAEFQWANFLRSKIELGSGRKAIAEAVDAAVVIAHTDAASKLPGFIAASATKKP
ncbi:MAG: hypothetical protein JWR16_361 [Nevskia sp.]|nr:hypothetical protein [Nevskia sp.]